MSPAPLTEPALTSWIDAIEDKAVASVKRASDQATGAKLLSLAKHNITLDLR